MAPIGVQLMKDVLSLVDGIGWPARVSWRLGHFSPGAVMSAGSDSWLRLALAPAGYHRDRGAHLADHPASPAHAGDRGLRVIAELLRHPLSAPPAAVGTQGRRDGRPDLTRAGFIGTLQRRCEQCGGPDRAGAGAVHQ